MKIVNIFVELIMDGKPFEEITEEDFLRMPEKIRDVLYGGIAGIIEEGREDYEYSIELQTILESSLGFLATQPGMSKRKARDLVKRAKDLQLRIIELYGMPDCLQLMSDDEDEYSDSDDENSND